MISRTQRCSTVSRLDSRTTTDTDRTIPATTLTSTVHSYYSFNSRTGGGLPSITLLGSRSDWDSILRRLDQLLAHGAEPRLFASRLRLVLRHFILGISAPTSPTVQEFRRRAVYGWVSASCLWSVEGWKISRPLEA